MNKRKTRERSVAKKNEQNFAFETGKGRPVPRPVPEKFVGLRLLCSLLLLVLAIALAFSPAQRMVRLWLGQDGMKGYKLEFKVDGVPAEWGYACWTGPITEGLHKFGNVEGEGPVNETRTLPPVLDHNIDGGNLKINGITFSKGIGVHAPSKIAFSLGGTFKHFSCFAGLDASASQSRGVIYSVRADGREVFKSPKLKSDADPFPIDISVSGVNELILCVETPEFEDVGSNVDWVNLKFEE